MKTILTLILATILSLHLVQAQDARAFYNTPYKTRNSGSFDRSTGVLTFSIGVPNIAISGYSYNGRNRVGFGPLYAKYEHGIMDEFGLGGQLAFAVGRYEYGNNERESIGAFHFAFLGYYHFNKLIPVRQLDVYAGAGLAIRNRSVRYSDDTFANDNDVTVGGAMRLGVRYYPRGPVAIYAETGYDNMSDINLGVTFRFQ
jgi:hypothetical protein